MLARQILSAILIFFFSLLPWKGYSQSGYEDVVYLKNGSIIHGVIIEQVPNVSIKIQTKDKNVFVFMMDEVQKITKEESPSAVTSHSGKEKRILTKDNIKKRGYTNITEITFGREQLQNHSNNALTGNAESGSQLSIGIQSSNGFLFNPHFFAGLGVGLHFYPGMALVPFFADARYYFTKKPKTAFVAAGIGYSFSYMEVFGFESTKDYFGGFMLNPAFGVKIHFRKDKAIALSLGYRYQEARIYTHNSIFNNSTPYRTDYYQGYTLGYTNLKFGFVF